MPHRLDREVLGVIYIYIYRFAGLFLRASLGCMYCSCAGFIAMYGTLASRDVDCCLIPESPFYLEGAGGLFQFIEKRLKENGHMVIVIAEGAGQDLLSESLSTVNRQEDKSGDKLLKDVGLWLSQKIKVQTPQSHSSCLSLVLHS